MIITNPYDNLPAEYPAAVFNDMSPEQAVDVIGNLCRIDMKASGILASVSAAQFILESDFGKSELAQNSNNCFGMIYIVQAFFKVWKISKQEATK